VSAVRKVIMTAVREAFGLLVDDGAVAIGILLAVGASALLGAPGLLGSGDAVGWVLFALVWLALAVSLRRARSAISGRNDDHVPIHGERSTREVGR
jgi:membrane protein implicated in regulation of membrane protease activity